MAYVNAKGDVIREKVLSRAAIDRIIRLTQITYPRDAATLRHLTRQDFRDWIHVQGPRDALLFAGSPDGHSIVHYQLTKRWYHGVRDAIWRGFHG